LLLSLLSFLSAVALSVVCVTTAHIRIIIAHTAAESREREQHMSTRREREEYAVTAVESKQEGEKQKSQQKHKGNQQARGNHNRPNNRHLDKDSIKRQNIRSCS